METGKDLDGSSSDSLHLANGSEGSLSKRLLGYGVETRGAIYPPSTDERILTACQVYFPYQSNNGQTASSARYSSSGSLRTLTSSRAFSLLLPGVCSRQLTMVPDVDSLLARWDRSRSG